MTTRVFRGTEDGQRVLKVTVKADGSTREFNGAGSGPELVAAFRVWLSSPDFWFPMAEGADEVDRAAAALEAAAPPPAPAEVERTAPPADRPITSKALPPLSIPDQVNARRLVHAMVSIGRPTTLMEIATTAGQMHYAIASRVVVKMVAAGVVQRTGHARGTKYALVDEAGARLFTWSGPEPEAAQPAAVATAGPAPSPAAAGAVTVESEAFRKELLRALSSGASYDTRELVRTLRHRYPDLSPAALEPVLDHLAREQAIRRIPLDAGRVRYQITRAAAATTGRARV